MENIMPQFSQITDEHFSQIVSEFNAQPEQRLSLSKDESLQLAQRLNEIIDIPIPVVHLGNDHFQVV